MNKIKTFFSWFGNDIKDIGVTFKEGDFKTKLSFLIFGLGPILRKSVVKGIAYLAVEVSFFIYMIQFGWQYLSKINTLGTIEKGIDPETFLLTDGDNSFFILLYGILSIMFIIGLYMIFSKYNDRSKKILNLYSLFHKLEVFSDEDFKKNFQEISRILGLSIIIEAIFLLSMYSSIHFIGYSLEYLGILVIFIYIGIRMYLSSKISQIKKR